MEQEELEKSNRSKYGEKDKDVISLMYDLSKEQGDAYCYGNIMKYVGRFTRPKSSKSNNKIDLLKAKDYLERMIEINEQIGQMKTEEVHEKK